MEESSTTVTAHTIPAGDASSSKSEISLPFVDKVLLFFRRSLREVAILVVLLGTGFYLYSSYQASAVKRAEEGTSQLTQVREHYIAYAALVSTPPVIDDTAPDKEAKRNEYQKNVSEARTKLIEAARILADFSEPFPALSADYLALADEVEGASGKAIEVISAGVPNPSNAPAQLIIAETGRLLKARLLLQNGTTRQEGIAALTDLSEHSSLVAASAAKTLALIASTPAEEETALQIVKAVAARLPAQGDFLSDDKKRLEAHSKTAQPEKRTTQGPS